MMTEFEAGVRELVARLRDFERRLKKVEDDAGAVEQFVKLITPGFGIDAPSAPNTTIQGTIKGCGVGVLAAQPVTILDAGSTVLGTGTSGGGGTYSIGIFLAANATVTISVVPTSSRYATTTASYAATSGVTNTGADLRLTAATSYACHTYCFDPINQTLTLTAGAACSGVTYPNDTLIYGPPPSWATGILGTANGWLGSAVINNTSISPTGSYLYWMPIAGGLNIIRQNPTPAAITVGFSGTGTIACGPPFSWTLTCGVSSNKFGGTIAG